MKTVPERLNKTKKIPADISPRRTNAKIIRTCAGIKIYRQVKEYPINQISLMKE
jgi:hypothetical protein